MYLSGWICLGTRQTNFGHMFLWGSRTRQAVMFACFSFFRGLILALHELRTNSKRTLALSCFLIISFFGVELFGFWSYKEIQLVDAFSYKFSVTRAKKHSNMLNPGFSCKKQLFHTTKIGQALTEKRTNP